MIDDKPSSLIPSFSSVTAFVLKLSTIHHLFGFSLHAEVRTGLGLGQSLYQNSRSTQFISPIKGGFIY